MSGILILVLVKACNGTVYNHMTTVFKDQYAICLVPFAVVNWYNNHHDDVIKWKHFPRYWPIVRGIHRSPVNSPHKGHWRCDLMFSSICAGINGWLNNREAGDLKRHRPHYDVTVMTVRIGDSVFKLLTHLLMSDVVVIVEKCAPQIIMLFILMPQSIFDKRSTLV